MQHLSTNNPRVAEIRGLSRQRKLRAASGQSVIEGPKLVAEALESGIDVTGVFVDAESLADRRIADCAGVAASAGCDVFTLDAGALDRVASTTNPQGIVAVARLSAASVDDLPTTDFALVGVDINDPGNAGTLMRAAVAAGAGAVVLLGDSVDVTNPKTIRASAGAVFRVPVIVERDRSVGLAALRSAGLTLLGAAGEATVACDATDLTGPVAIVLGNEAHGLSNDVRTQLDDLLRIEMPGPVESLNVAMAGAILCHEVARQRRVR